MRLPRSLSGATPVTCGNSLSPPTPIRRRTVPKSDGSPASWRVSTQDRAWASLLSTSVPSTSKIIAGTRASARSLILPRERRVAAQQGDREDQHQDDEAQEAELDHRRVEHRAGAFVHLAAILGERRGLEGDEQDSPD